MCQLTIDGQCLELRKASLNEIMALRHAILRAFHPLDTARFDGDHEASTLHFGVFEGDETIACVSFMLTDFQGRSAWQLRGMATAQEWQGKGIGAALLKFAEQILARDTEVHRLWCNARIGAISFYQRFGWSNIFGVFDVPAVGPHRRMTKNL